MQTLPDKDLTSLSTITGMVNGDVVEGKIRATFNTGKGGASSCNFTKLPKGFNPGTFGTHV